MLMCLNALIPRPPQALVYTLHKITCTRIIYNTYNQNCRKLILVPLIKEPFTRINV